MEIHIGSTCRLSSQIESQGWTPTFTSRQKLEEIQEMILGDNPSTLKSNSETENVKNKKKQIE